MGNRIKFGILSVLIFGGSVETMNCELVALRNTSLAQTIAQKCKKELIIPTFQEFADGELNVTLSHSEQFSNKTVVIIQSTGHPVNENSLGVAFLAQELKNAGAKKIIAIIPYFGYSRQERSAIPGKPGHVAVIAKLFEGAGIDEIIVVELHDESVVNLFSIPVHTVSVKSIIADLIKKQLNKNVTACLVAPDQGAAEYVQSIAQIIGIGALTFEKERYAADQTRIVSHTGTCSGGTGIIIDDIMATGGTAINVCQALHTHGYDTMYGYFVHPVLAGNAVQKVKDSSFNKIFVGNTIPLSTAAKNASFIEVFDVSSAIMPVLEKVIR